MGSPILELRLPPGLPVMGACNAKVYLAISIGFVVVYFFRSWHQGRRRAVDVPFYKAGKLRWMFDAESLIRDSYRKFQNITYQIEATEGPQIIIPARFLAELRSLPESTLSATEAVSEALQSKYTGFSAGHNGHLLTTYIKCKLSKNLVRLVPQLRAELDHIVAAEFPPCDDWTPVKFQPFALRAVARISGRAFVGPGLNRTEAWMDTSINYAVHVFIAVVKLQLFPEWLRPVGQYLVSELGQIKRDIAAAKSLLQPIIAKRLRDRKAGYDFLSPSSSSSSSSSFSSLASSSPSPRSPECPSDDMIQWLIDALPEDEEPDIQAHTELQLIVAAASIHTTNNLLTECMYDLAANQDAQEVLREEARLVLERENGWLRKDSMARLEKMDSFMKETQRLSGNITSFIRKVIEPITLSDGTHLPSGTRILAPLAAISHDERFFPGPDRFDALRFYRLRQQQQQVDEQSTSNRWQFASVAGETNLHFGAGKHACPGRFFAASVIKMALAFFLLKYEFKLRDGMERPKAMAMVMSKAANPNIELLFRRIYP